MGCTGIRTHSLVFVTFPSFSLSHQPILSYHSRSTILSSLKDYARLHHARHDDSSFHYPHVDHEDTSPVPYFITRLLHMFSMLYTNRFLTINTCTSLYIPSYRHPVSVASLYLTFTRSTLNRSQTTQGLHKSSRGSAPTRLQTSANALTCDCR